MRVAEPSRTPVVYAKLYTVYAAIRIQINPNRRLAALPRAERSSGQLRLDPIDQHGAVRDNFISHAGFAYSQCEPAAMNVRVRQSQSLEVALTDRPCSARESGLLFLFGGILQWFRESFALERLLPALAPQLANFGSGGNPLKINNSAVSAGIAAIAFDDRTCASATGRWQQRLPAVQAGYAKW
ncbi:hypothetical protein [Variovorax boronicumulans]|uniref:hypothetical protein n=1 Tax=Variovorax boronicumulans TaxID=436515 RepID=UPI00132F7E7E|nr:hypothetical protein [Variovorax boronicumulans]